VTEALVAALRCPLGGAVGWQRRVIGDNAAFRVWAGLCLLGAVYFTFRS